MDVGGKNRDRLKNKWPLILNKWPHLKFFFLELLIFAAKHAGSFYVLIFLKFEEKQKKCLNIEKEPVYSTKAIPIENIKSTR